MFEHKKNVTEESTDKKSVSSPNFAVFVVIVAFCIIGMAAFFWIFDVPERLLGVLGYSDGRNGNVTDWENVPDMSADSSFENELLYGEYDRDPYEHLLSIEENTRYIQKIRVTTSLLQKTNTEFLTISRDGNSYRIEGEGRLVICDGEKLYVKEGFGSAITDCSYFSLEKETGLTSLVTIQNSVAEENVIYNISDNERLLIAKISDSKNNVLKEYAISLEEGIVLSEKTTYMNSVVYRTVETDEIDLFVADGFPSDYFTIPMDE